MNKSRTQAREDARPHLRDYLRSIGVDTDRAAKGNAPCPICQKGQDTPCFHFYEGSNTWKCYSCGESGDIFDLYARMHGLPSPKDRSASARDVMEAVYRLYGIPYGCGTEEMEVTPSFSADGLGSVAVMEAESEVQDYSSYCASVEENLPSAEAYLLKRGISLETARALHLGFAPEWRHPKAPPAVPVSPRVIVPTGPHSYLARDIREPADMKDSDRRYSKSKVGKVELFNRSALNDASRPCFVVEGEFDAMSIVECGFSSIALGSTSNVQRLIGELEERRNGGEAVPKLVLAMDNDPAGEKCAQNVEKELQRIGMGFTIADSCGLYGGAKDANEALVLDREGFRSRLSEFGNRQKSREESDYRSGFGVCSFREGFQRRIEQNSSQFNTGFPLLDKTLGGFDGGGIPIGLYVVGGASSLGKTSWALQICDQMAGKGQDVLMFSLEMGAHDLIAKNVSRMTFLHGKTVNAAQAWKSAYPASHILNMGLARRCGVLSEGDEQNIRLRMEEYFRSFGQRVFIYEGKMNGTTVDDLRNRIVEHVEATGCTPVVVIDYLQVLRAQGGQFMSDKSQMDLKISQCKLLTRDFKTPVIVLSSINREHYYKPIAISAFKESGAIEYTADVVLGLQCGGLDSASDDEARRTLIESNLRKDERDVELKILKNRFGATGGMLRYRFCSKFNYFQEEEDRYNYS